MPESGELPIHEPDSKRGVYESPDLKGLEDLQVYCASIDEVYLIQPD
jgi:hypothetical protein